MNRVIKFGGQVSKAILQVSAAILLAITLIIIALLVYEFWRHRFVSKADAQMKALGGSVTYGRRAWDGEITVWFFEASFDGAKLKKAVAVLQALDKDDRVAGLHLHLSGTGVSDVDMAAIEGLSKLKYIDLSRTAVTREGVLTLLQKYPQTRINTNDWRPQTSK